MTVDIFERLAILTPGTTFRGEATARATGQRLTAADISYLVAGLPPIQEALILAKYCGHPDAMLRALMLQVVKQTMQTRWLKRRGKTLDARPNWYTQKFARHVDALVSQAVTEILASRNCRPCKGTGAVITDEGKVDQCQPCGGSGRAHSMRERARGAGINKDQWQRDGWAQDYAEVLAFLCAAEGEAARHVKARMR